MKWIIFGGIHVTGRYPKKYEDSLPVGKQIRPPIGQSW